ncbi:transposase, YhgA-like family protein [Orientia chuto str. Dubai]|uniref:Transposase, YhgA-like family protein n=1 Tax=Orientia chuto str. Dubai TaxID=1359168 RepID=A0A0F3MKX2_9RICK|nr:transposase, YhgA-like family protein [Orientia chuto str. Dubai]
MSKNLKHDALFKRLMTNPIAALDYLKDYLPSRVIDLVDLNTVTLEKDSFVEADLRRSMCDILLSMKTK